MNDIDRYLDQACRQITGPDSLRAHLRKELKEHLEEAIDALVAEGMSQNSQPSRRVTCPVVSVGQVVRWRQRRHSNHRSFRRLASFS